MKEKSLKLWSVRFSGARAVHWVYERDVTEETKDAWLKVFRENEPNVNFVLDMHKPSKAGRWMMPDGSVIRQ